MNHAKSICLSLLLLLSLSSHAQTSDSLHHLYSEILSEERSFVVQLPDSYEDEAFYANKHYPVAILLDGERLFPLTASLVQSLSGPSVEQIPEMIVVGVYNTHRNRDFLPTTSLYSSSGERLDQLAESGGAEAFHRFLSEELLPYLDSTYRTAPYRLLIGHSFAGLYTAYEMQQFDSFQALLAIDPSLWWDEAWLIEQLEQKSPTKTKRFYHAQANNPFDPGVARSASGIAQQSFRHLLDSLPKVRYQYQFFENEDHFSVPTPALLAGLKSLFSDYQIPLETLMDQDSLAIENYYHQISEEMGITIHPPGRLFNQIGMFLLSDSSRQEQALMLLGINQVHYPTSYLPWQSLGMAYERLRRTPEAIECYQQVLRLQPDNAYALAGVERLAEP